MVNVRNNIINPCQLRIRYGEQIIKYILMMKINERQLKIMTENIFVVANTEIT